MKPDDLLFIGRKAGPPCGLPVKCPICGALVFALYLVREFESKDDPGPGVEVMPPACKACHAKRTKADVTPPGLAGRL